MEAFKNNVDIHTATAVNLFGADKDNVDPFLRSKAKAINFGIVYGKGEFSLAQDLNVTRKEAKEYIDGYFEKYQGYRKIGFAFSEQLTATDIPTEKTDIPLDDIVTDHGWEV